MQSDQLFKEFLKEFLPQFLTLFFPEEAAQLDWSSVRFLDKEMFTDTLVGDVREADLIAEVRTNTGEPELILIHIEVQAQREKGFAERMFNYYCRLRSQYTGCTRIGILGRDFSLREGESDAICNDTRAFSVKKRPG